MEVKIVQNEEKWIFKSLGEIAPLQRGFDLPTSQLQTGTYPVVYSNGILNYHAVPMCKAPGVVTGRSGTIGKVNYIDADYWPHNTTLWVTDFKGNHPKFVYYLYSSIGLENFRTGSGVPTLNRNDVHAFRVLLPPLAEQRAIAEVLSDIDAQIAALDTLIAKKRDIKQGAMQELLTGRRRLPGFTGAWTEVPFGSLVMPRQSRFNPRFSIIEEFCVELDDIESGTGQLISAHEPTTTISQKTRFYRGDVLFGKLRAYLKKFWLADRDGVCSTEIWALSPNLELTTSGFLAQIVRQDQFIAAASESYGTHMPRSDWKVVREVQVALPSLEEQIAISSVLQDVDDFIAALEAQRRKTADLKQAMMQELLTGKTRLI